YYTYFYFFKPKNKLNLNKKKQEEYESVFPEIIDLLNELSNISEQIDNPLGEKLNRITRIIQNIIEINIESNTQITDQSKRIILNYSASLLEIIRKYKYLEENGNNEIQLKENKGKIFELMNSIEKIFSSIENNFLNKQFFDLEIEIETMKKGIKLDGNE
ncbi:MAG: 5-bromo-4-chloroindolyl phosphate hydrolysis family protein, partial [Leptospiraceae bacterium]|nr:5-bromo-4-chloroindolyl phosphate hydrolysis family protein [Leptospiraceae bacterium]